MERCSFSGYFRYDHGMSYNIFAQVYDDLMDEELYDLWIDFTKKNLSDTHENVLDLACGAGHLAIKMKQEGYQVTGLDLSSEMIALAKERAEEVDMVIPFIIGNMLDLSVVEQFDAVTCYCDSLCYLPDAEAVQKTFEEISQHLTEDGVFLFDVHSIHQIDEIFPGYTFNDQTEEISFLWKSYVGEFPHSIEHDLTFFVYQEEIDLYERFDETHKERTYPIKQYLSMLKKAGFTSVEVSADYGKGKILNDSTRWFFVCRKETK